MRMGKWLVCMSLAVAVAAGGCETMNKAGRLVALQQLLSKEFQDHAVKVNIEPGGTLAIGFQAARLSAMSDAEQADVARRAAELVRDRYREYSQFQQISVGFRASASGGGSTRREPYVFSTAELGPPAAEPAPTGGTPPAPSPQ